MNVLRYMAITLILITLFHNNVAASDKKEMWAEPGMSIGNIKVSSSYQDIINLLGEPQEIGGSKGWPGLRYKDVVIELDNTDAFLNAIKNQRDWKPKIEDGIVKSIVAYQYVKTRGGLKIGSSIKEVLDVFGGSAMRFEPNKAANSVDIIECNSIDINKYPESNPFIFLINNYSGYVLELRYFSDGISFYFKIDDTTLSPTVFAIAVSNKTACKITPNKF